MASIVMRVVFNNYGFLSAHHCNLLKQIKGERVVVVDYQDLHGCVPRKCRSHFSISQSCDGSRLPVAGIESCPASRCSQSCENGTGTV